MDHAEIVRLYGPWAGRDPADAVRLMDGYAGRWWIAGGRAIEVLTGPVRSHGDLDVSIPRSDVPALHRHLAGRLDVWLANSGTLTPLVDVSGPVPAPANDL